MKKPLLIATVLSIFVLALALSGCGAVLEEVAKLAEYEVDGESVPASPRW